MLTVVQQATLLICALDKLPFLGDYLNEDDLFTDGCCPCCCAECGVVRDVEHSGNLDEFITRAPDFMWASSAWWRDGRVDRIWLYAVWDCQSRPHCETGKVEDTYSLDHIAERVARQLKLTVPEAYGLLEERLRYEEEISGDDEQPKPIPAQL